MILAFLLACATLASLGLAAPPPGLHGCANHLAFNNTVVRLPGTTSFSQYIQCTYQQNHPDGSITTDYCWYDVCCALLQDPSRVLKLTLASVSDVPSVPLPQQPSPDRQPSGMSQQSSIGEHLPDQTFRELVKMCNGYGRIRWISRSDPG